MRPLDAMLGGQREQQVGPRVPAAVLWVAKARNWLLLGPQRPDRRNRVPALRHDAGKEPPRHFGAAQHHRAAAEQPCRHRAVEGLGGRRIGHPRGHDAWHQAMLGDRGKHGIGKELLRRGGSRACHQQPEVAGEVHLADNLRAKVEPAHPDLLGIRGADGGKGLVLLSNAHGAISISSKFELVSAMRNR